MFSVLHMIVQLHHPEGRLQNEEGSLAYNWSKWNKHLNTILEIITLEVKVLQRLVETKFRLKNDNILKDYRTFFVLAASVFHQVRVPTNQ